MLPEEEIRRANAVSAYGHVVGTTPFIDSLAAEGILYRHAYDDKSDSNIPSEAVYWARGNSWVLISAALMSASAVYATYVAVGNQGGLTASGMDKIVDAYRHQMEQVQAMRKAELEAAGTDGLA